MLGAIRVGKRKKVQPVFSWKILWTLSLLLFGLSVVGYVVTYFRHINVLQFFIVAILLNVLVIYISLRTIKKIAKGLTVEDASAEISY